LASIADEGNLSAAVQLEGLSPVAFVIGTGWVAADLTFQASYDGGANFFNVHESGTDTELTVQAGASRYIGLLDAQRQPLQGVTQIKVRSGTSGAPVTQTAGPQVIAIICTD
jgi:hypothetical protein